MLLLRYSPHVLEVGLTTVTGPLELKQHDLLRFPVYHPAIFGYDEEYKAVWLAGYNRQNGLDGPSSRTYREVRPPRYAHLTNESACTPS